MTVPDKPLPLLERHTPFYTSIFPLEELHSDFLYCEEGEHQHFGGLFNSLYPNDLKELIRAEEFSLSGTFPTGASLEVWLHSPKKAPALLISTKAVTEQVTLLVPRFPILPGQRLTLKVLSEAPYKPTFSWGIPAPTQQPRKVSLAIIICTYNNEELVTSNVNKLVSSPEWQSIPADLIVVNNGGLDHPLTLNLPRVKQFKQANTGGAGGFSRGIKEALDAPENYTHVLLMDDDVKFHLEVISRTIKFHQYSINENVIGGSMLKLEDPTCLHEAGGILRHKSHLGGKSAVKPGFLDEKKLSDLGKTHKLHYNSWWFCSFSTSAVKAIGMPLPIFIHGDDLEYGLRLRHHGYPCFCPGGISLWHASFEGKHRTWIHYFNFRNHIIRLLSQQGDMRNHPRIAKRHLKRMVTVNLIRNDYGAVALILKAYQDLLDHPESYDKILCYHSFIQELNQHYQKASVQTKFQLKPIAHQSQSPFRLKYLPQALYKYITVNGSTTPSPTTTHCHTVKSRIGWWEVPPRADLTLSYNQGEICYPRNPNQARTLWLQMRQLSKQPLTPIKR